MEEGSPVWGCRFRRRPRLMRDFCRCRMPIKEDYCFRPLPSKEEEFRVSRLPTQEEFCLCRLRKEPSQAFSISQVDLLMLRMLRMLETYHVSALQLHLGETRPKAFLLDQCSAGVRNWRNQTAVEHLLSLGQKVAERIPLELLLQSALGLAGSMKHVMLSGRYEQIEYMRRVMDRLQRQGLKTFMVAPGDDFVEQTVFGLQNAFALVVFGTDTYGAKTGTGFDTYYELKYASENQLLLIPLQLCDTWPPRPQDHDGGTSGQALNRAVLSKMGCLHDREMQNPEMMADEIATTIKRLQKSEDQDLLMKRKLINRLLGSQVGSVEDVPIALEDVFRFSLLCRQLSRWRGLESMILSHLISQAEISDEKLQDMICQLFYKHGEELKLGLTPVWSQNARWLLEALVLCGSRHVRLPIHFATWVVDHVEELSPKPPFATPLRSSDPPSKSEKNNWSWLFLGLHRLEPSAMRNNLEPKTSEERFPDLQLLPCESLEDLYAAAVEMQRRFASLKPRFSLAEEMIWALRELRQVRGFQDTCLRACAAWLHCAQLWHRHCKAEAEAKSKVVDLLEASQVQVVMRKFVEIPSLKTLWRRALTLPSETMWSCDHPPGAFLCDMLAIEVEVASASAVRRLHDHLSSLTLKGSGAELMWKTTEAGGPVLGPSGLKAGLLLTTSAGPIFVQLRVLDTGGDISGLREFFKTMEMGDFLPSDVQPLWATWLHLEVCLRKAARSTPKALQAALAETSQVLKKDAVFADFACMWNLEAYSKQLKRLLREESQESAPEGDYRLAGPLEPRINVKELAESRLRFWEHHLHGA